MPGQERVSEWGQGPGQNRTRRQHPAQPTPPRHTNREPCPYPRRPAIYHPPRNPRRPAPHTRATAPVDTGPGRVGVGPLRDAHARPGSTLPAANEYHYLVYAVDDNDKVRYGAWRGEEVIRTSSNVAIRPAQRGDARRLLSPRTWTGPGVAAALRQVQGMPNNGPPRQRGGRTAGLALPAPSCARMPDGQDIAAGGRVQPSRVRDRLHAQTAHRLQKKHLPTSPTTSPSAWSGSRRSPTCRGRSWPAVSAPIPTP